MACLLVALAALVPARPLMAAACAVALTLVGSYAIVHPQRQIGLGRRFGAMLGLIGLSGMALLLGSPADGPALAAFEQALAGPDGIEVHRLAP